MDKEYFAPINTVSRELGIPAYTLRYWEKQFPTIVRPVAGAGGRRYYRPETGARLRAIQDLLYNRGMTITGVKKLIHSGKFLNGNAESWPERVIEPEYDTDFSINDLSEFDDFADEPIRNGSIAPLDGAKIDLAIGLLDQARDLLK